MSNAGYISKSLRNRCHVLLFALLLVGVAADPASAYVGPGAGLTFIGSLIALVAAVFAAIFGFVWFPLKRLLRSRRSKQDSELLDSE